MTNYDDVARDTEPNVELAQELLARCQPLVEGSAQWRYLTETRGIPADAVRYSIADLRALEPSIPGFDRLARGIVSLLRDQDGEITGLAVEACGVGGEALKGSDGRTARKTYALKKRGQIDALFRVDPVGSGAMICYACEGRLVKPLAVAALIGNPAVVGWGGLHGLGRCLPPEPTVVVVEDALPADPTKASLHDLAMTRGCDRLIAGGRIVLRAGGPPCGCCKDIDEALGKHPADDLRAWITAAEPAELSLDGEARRCAKIRSPLRQAEEIAKVIAKHGLRKKGTTKGFRAQVAQYAGGHVDDDEDGAQDGTGSEMTFEEVLPWPDPVDGRELLDDMAAALRRHAHCSDADIALGVLWVVHAERRWHGNVGTLPRCAVTAGKEDSGKTHYAMACGSMMDRAEHTTSPRPANIYRAIEAHQCAFILDECDVWYPRNEDMRDIVNSGFNKRGASVLRVEDVGHDGKRKLESRRYSTFTPMMLVGNNLERTLARTVMSRALVVKLRPARVTDTVEDLFDNPPAVERLFEIARRVKRWVQDFEAVLVAAKPARPDGVINRLWIVWRPLLAIADAAGGEWPTKARQALEVARVRGSDPGLSHAMLSDVFRILLSAPKWRLHTNSLIAELLKVEEREWSAYGKARALIRDIDVARLLEPYELRSKQLKITGRNRNGYVLDDVLLAVETYAPTVLCVLSPAEKGLYHVYLSTRHENANVSSDFEGRGQKSADSTSSTSPSTDQKVDPTRDGGSTAFPEENQSGRQVDTSGTPGEETHIPRGNGADGRPDGAAQGAAEAAQPKRARKRRIKGADTTPDVKEVPK
jgi:Protein of unknown function (DUF3631)